MKLTKKQLYSDKFAPFIYLYCSLCLSDQEFSFIQNKNLSLAEYVSKYKFDEFKIFVSERFHL